MRRTLSRIGTAVGVIPNSPWLMWLILLLVISAVEYAIMLVLPRYFPGPPQDPLEPAIDSIVLTLAVAPVMWLLFVRPMLKAAALREQYLADVFVTVEKERRRIARELHDGVGQLLTVLVSGLRSLPDEPDCTTLPRRAEDLRSIAHRALQETKRMAMGLRPSILDDFGLAPALERAIEELNQNHEIQISLDAAALGETRLSESVEVALFRIFQEAMQNILKHSKARHASVKLSLEEQHVSLDISDDGCGIDPRILQLGHAPAGHLGLLGMQERATMNHGQLHIESEPGRGTRILVRLPRGESGA